MKILDRGKGAEPIVDAKRRVATDTRRLWRQQRLCHFLIFLDYYSLLRGTPVSALFLIEGWDHLELVQAQGDESGIGRSRGPPSEIFVNIFHYCCIASLSVA